jgi:CRISPR-associated protein Csd1
MILQALHRYYYRKQSAQNPQDRLPDLSLEKREIPFVIEIDTCGSVVNLSDTRKGEGKRQTGQFFLVPQGEKKTSRVTANLLWDSAEYVLGIPDSTKLATNRGKGKESEYRKRLEEMQTAFASRVDALVTQTAAEPGLLAVQAFRRS